MCLKCAKWSTGESPRVNWLLLTYPGAALRLPKTILARRLIPQLPRG